MEKSLSSLMKLLGIECKDYRMIRNITYKIELATEYDLFIGLDRKNHDLVNDLQLAKERGIVSLAKEDADYVYEDCSYAYGYLLQALHDFPSKDICVIGVTGTNGKTTITSYLYQILKQLQQKVLLIGSNGIYYENLVEETVNTTPSSEVLAKWFAYAKQQGIQYIVMEVSSIGLHQKRIAGILFDYVIVSNVAIDHLDYHGSLLNYHLAKYQIFSYLKNKGIAVLNTEDSIIRSWAMLMDKEYVEYNEHVIDMIQLNMDSSLFVFKEFLIYSNQVSVCNIYNLCACICVLKHLGYKHQQITAVCKKLDVVKGRYEMVHRYPFVIIDYAHTEEALRQILSFYRKFTKRLIVVFGCGGNRDQSKRSLMGKVACELADMVILTEDNSRDENIDTIIGQIQEGCNGKEEVIVSRVDAIKYALLNAKNNDIIIIAGKGCERYIVNRDMRQPLLDVDIVQQFYKGR